jgi:VWFA-related protein
MTFGRRLGGLCLAGLLAAGPSGPAVRAQAPPTLPTFSSEVELITVDAVALDADGRPISGLTRDDFVLTEDGRPQEIASFEAFVLNRDAATAAEAAPVASNEPGEGGNGRAFALIVDDVRMAATRVAGARAAAASFLERSVRDGDEVTLGTASGDVWWSARLPEGRADLLALLARVKGRGSDTETVSIARMSDYEAYRIANYENSPSIARAIPAGPASGRGSSPGGDTVPSLTGHVKERVMERWLGANLCTPTSCEGMVRGYATDIDAARRDRTELTLRSVRRGLEALAPVRGRKSLLLLSPGFLQDSAADLRGIAATSREANTAVYFVDVKGLVAFSGFGSAADSAADARIGIRERAAINFEEAAFESAGSQTLADDTGGFSVRNTNDLGAGIDRIAEESRVFYLLGFHPPPGKSPGEWRKLRVEVKRPGVNVRARRGYSLRAEAEAAGAKRSRKEKAPGLAPSVARALDSAHEAAGIPLRVMVYVLEPREKQATRVLVAAEFDASRASAARGADGGSRIELSVLVTHRDTGRTFRYDEALRASVPAGEAPAWRALTREFDLPAGVAQARVVVRDPARDALGAVTQRFEVPAPGALRVSTPILTDRLEPASAGQTHPRPALAVHRIFAARGPLYCQFEVFGAARGAAAPPRVRAGLTLRAGDGLPVRETAPTPIATGPDGRLVRLVGIALDGLAEGRYDLVLDVQDETSGARLERHEPFTLARETASR